MQIAEEHMVLTRRYFLGLSAAGIAALSTGARADRADDELAAIVAKLEYLTKDEAFLNVERGNPLPYTLPPAKLREIGMTRETWKLEVIPDSGARIENPLTIQKGNALDFEGLMRLAEKKAVRYLKVVTCNNLNAPLGMGLWEGVPLREVVWMTKPVSDIRRVFYYGHHNEDPKQMFRSSLPMSKVMEEPPGTPPVMLCYKLNGQFLTGKRGGPVRMIVPDAYGFKSVKWLQRIALTNLPGENDTYADEGNDVDSPMKTFARFLSLPPEVKGGDSLPVTGVAQVGTSGLSKVQYWANRQDSPLPLGDPYLTAAPWHDARILPAPSRWGGGLAGGIPAETLGFRGGKPREWPLRYSIVHWAALLRDIPPGKYFLYCRTIDANGIAQPLPRPFGRGGLNHIDRSPFVVRAS